MPRNRCSPEAAAPTLPPGWHLEVRETVGSTNEEAKALAVAGAGEFTLVWAKEQRQGRGRRGRGWASPPGNLYMSLLLRPKVTRLLAAQVGFVAAVALAEVLRELVPAAVDVALKWPNDVLIDRRKVSGILPEALAHGDSATVEALVLGIGVNVASHPAGTPWPATSLSRIGIDIAVESLLERLAAALDVWLQRWRRDGFRPVRERWLAAALGRGEPVEVHLQHTVVSGRFFDLDLEGALIVAEADGSNRHVVRAGEVFFPELLSKG